jgi:hypothetical protein
MKRLPWKYIAGLVDGEGCLDFQIERSKYEKVSGEISVSIYICPRLRIALSETCKFILDILQANHGGNVWCATRRHNPNWHDAYYWQLENRRLRPFLQNIVNHMYLKKEQAKFLIWVIDNLRGKQIKQHGYENIDAARLCAKKELSAMKADPQRLSEVAVRNIIKILKADAIVQTA